MKKAVVLLSGGLDSTTLLYYARHMGYKCACLTFSYGQRHKKEIQIARKIARMNRCEHADVSFQFPWKGSSLIDTTRALPRRKTIDQRQIPSTYVPGRNIIFLSFAVSLAEVKKAEAVFIGANAIDYSGYPDCRPKFFKAYQKVIQTGMKTGVEGKKIKILSPFLRMTKAQIIRLGKKLKVPYQHTWSCYEGGNKPCGRCDSCLLRRKGFEEAGVKDPLCP